MVRLHPIFDEEEAGLTTKTTWKIICIGAYDTLGHPGTVRGIPGHTYTHTHTRTPHPNPHPRTRGDHVDL